MYNNLGNKNYLNNINQKNSKLYQNQELTNFINRKLQRSKENLVRVYYCNNQYYENKPSYGIYETFYGFKNLNGTVEIVKPTNLLGAGAFNKVYLTEKVEEIRIPQSQPYLKEVVLRSRQQKLSGLELELNKTKNSYLQKLIGYEKYFDLSIAEDKDGFEIHEKAESDFSKVNIKPEHTKSLIDAVEILIKNELIHKDIKPENILYYKDGSVKIADFDLMVDLKNNNTDGSFGYMPFFNQQAKCHDIYSLIVTLMKQNKKIGKDANYFVLINLLVKLDKERKLESKEQLLSMISIVREFFQNLDKYPPLNNKITGDFLYFRLNIDEINNSKEIITGFTMKELMKKGMQNLEEKFYNNLNSFQFTEEEKFRQKNQKPGMQINKIQPIEFNIHEEQKRQREIEEKMQKKEKEELKKQKESVRKLLEEFTEINASYHHRKNVCLNKIISAMKNPIGPIDLQDINLLNIKDAPKKEELTDKNIKFCKFNLFNKNSSYLNIVIKTNEVDHLNQHGRNILYKIIRDLMKKQAENKDSKEIFTKKDFMIFKLITEIENNLTTNKFSQIFIPDLEEMQTQIESFIDKINNSEDIQRKLIKNLQNEANKQRLQHKEINNEPKILPSYQSREEIKSYKKRGSRRKIFEEKKMEINRVVIEGFQYNINI